MRDLPLNALRALAAVFETGGVRPAARMLGVSHSAVSRHLRELQAWLGIALFENASARAPRLTVQGEHLARAAAASLGALDHAVGTFREARRSNAVTVGTSPSLAGRWLLPRLAQFRESTPWVEVSVVADQRLADPAPDASQINLRMGDGRWPLVECEPFMDDVLFPVMSPGFWAAHGRPENLAALAGLTLLHDRDPFAAWETWAQGFADHGLDLRQGPRFSSSDLVLQAAAQGLGVALARGRLVERDVSAGLLVCPFADSTRALPQAYWIVLSPHLRRSSAVNAVLDWLRAQGSGADPGRSSPSDG
ncbi:MAG TPA: LysR substrate-binding domain-containing protein [Allosphingosinicella sp.]|jgi:LysR family glycine cleavage system transcriptional activator